MRTGEGMGGLLGPVVLGVWQHCGSDAHAVQLRKPNKEGGEEGRGGTRRGKGEEGRGGRAAWTGTQGASAKE